MPREFDAQPHLIGDTLSLRPLRQGDFADLHAAASDPTTWAGHPATDRYRETAFQVYFDFLLQNGGALVVLDRQTEKVIGCSRYYTAPDRPGDVSIGFTFINNHYWGGTTNFELKRLMLDHAFQTVETVWFHIATTNIRSQKATAKLGAVHAYTATLDLSGTPTEWMCFRLNKADWENVSAAR